MSGKFAPPGKFDRRHEFFDGSALGRFEPWEKCCNINQPTIRLHELCHTRYLNHSRSYWHLVEQLYPRYEKAEAWFKDYGFLLNMAA